jgi:hypothetical protein
VLIYFVSFHIVSFLFILFCFESIGYLDLNTIVCPAILALIKTYLGWIHMIKTHMKLLVAIFFWFLFMVPLADAQECSGAECQCNDIFGIGLVQGSDGFGRISNFELAVPHSGGGFSAYYRDNHIKDITRIESHTWYGPKSVDAGDINGIAMVENKVITPWVPGHGNLEVVAIKNNGLYHYWRDRGSKQWSSESLIAEGVTGQPGFVQSKKMHSNFEVVVPLASGGLAHYWRDNTKSFMPWHGPTVFAQGRIYESVSLVESNYGGGNLEIVARSGETLYHLWRGGNSHWSSESEIRVDGGNAIKAKGVHSFIQGETGGRGNFELIVPLVAGGLVHYYRNNDTLVEGAHPWLTGGWVDSGRDYSSAGVMLSKFGNLEVVGRRSHDGALAAFYSNWTYTSWSHFANNPGEPVWAGAVFGGEPCSDPKTQGVWQDPIDTGAIGAHIALLPTGNVLMFGFGDNNDMGYSEVFDPITGLSAIPSHNGDLPHAFCSGHALLSNGELWVAGGNGETHQDDSYIFNSVNSTWTQLDDLGPDPILDGRWYPTLSRLANGSVIAISGSTRGGRLADSTEANSSWQTLDIDKNLSPKYEVPNPFAPLDNENSIMLYPFVYQLPTPRGGLLVHSERTSRVLYTDTKKWDPSIMYDTEYEYNRNYPGSGSSVMLHLSPEDNYTARIMLFGGSGDVPYNEVSNIDVHGIVPATNSVEMLDLGKLNPDWEYVAPMNSPRVLNNAVLLPDGTVFVVGGSSHGASDNGRAAVMSTEMYHPDRDEWTKTSPMRVARLYHSTAMLLPDGRVMTAGRDHAFNNVPYKWPERRVEIFSPPYLESGHPRPVIDEIANTTPSFGQNLTVNLSPEVLGWNVEKAVLIAPGAVTHAYDQSQRAINLDISLKSGNSLTLQMPPNGKVAPPGYYMLFLVSDKGVPSVSKFIKLQK